MEKHILIIGAGVAGLAAGVYARLNGFRATIFELHDLPGGLCTAWERKGYVFDGCIHYLFGSGEGQPFNQMWHELGTVQNRPMINHAEYQRITDGEHTLTVYTDPDKLHAHMADLSPDDEPLIRQFCEGVRQFTEFDMSVMYQKPKSLMNPAEWGELGLKMLPYLGAVTKW
ncbi:MAG TPA: NAD(P)-binding protein, partial [Anaerolineales bacterium]|nr:NAD(P)-binding protein [Anaerolineales bacterium]